MAIVPEFLPRGVSNQKSEPLYLAKLANVISVQPKRYDPDTYTLEEPIIYTDEKGRAQVKGCDFHNYIRWRYTDQGDMESTGKIVKWEDGTYTLFIGDEAFEVNFVQSSHNYSYLRYRDDYVEQQNIDRRMMFKPCSIKGRLRVRKLENELNPIKTTRLVHLSYNPETQKKKLEVEIDQKIRMEKQKDAPKDGSDDEDRPTKKLKRYEDLDDDFEEDEEEELI